MFIYYQIKKASKPASIDALNDMFMLERKLNEIGMIILSACAIRVIKFRLL
jgi:hypothetical protein